ncbi:MAG: hypothetical protein OXD01_00335 [Gammaproteobacteria bacterium]|nr:hypothetical protein [Gammaproteobacteria bacterium]
MQRIPPALHNIGIDLNAKVLADFACDYPVKLVHGYAYRFLTEYVSSLSITCILSMLCLQRVAKISRQVSISGSFRDCQNSTRVLCIWLLSKYLEAIIR